MSDFKVRFKGIKRLDHTAVDLKPWAQLAFEADHLVTYDSFVDWYDQELRWLQLECESRSTDVHVGGGVHAVPGMSPEGMEFGSPTDIELIGATEFAPEWLLTVILRLDDQLNPSAVHSPSRGFTGSAFRNYVQSTAGYRLPIGIAY